MLSDPEFYKNLVARIPLGRIAEPDDVKNAVLFFAVIARRTSSPDRRCTWMAGSRRRSSSGEW